MIKQFKNIKKIIAETKKKLKTQDKKVILLKNDDE